MALQSDYTSGTLTVAANGTAVTGSGTAWLTAGFQEGDLLVANGYFGIVGSVESNTALTLAQPWRGGDLTASAYRLRYQGDGSRISAQARQLTELLGVSGNLESLADITGTANSLPYFTGVGQMALTTLTPFARTLLDDASSSTALTTLGVSDFIKTLMDDADQAAALATLGAASSADLTSGLADKYPNASGLANASAIGTNTTAIATNTAAIAANTTAIANTVSAASAQTLTATQQAQARSNISAALRGQLYGLTLSNNTTDATNDWDIAAGEAASDDTNPVLMVLASAITKQVDAAWAAGTNAGGWLDGSSMPNGTGHCFVMCNPNTGAVDVGFSASLTPTLPTGYTQKRRIGSVRRVAGVNIAVRQFGDHFNLVTVVNEISTSTATSEALLTLSVPVGIIVSPKISVNIANSSGITEYRVGNGANTTADIRMSRVSNADSGASAYAELQTNTSAQIRHTIYTTGAITGLLVYTAGWIDTRGRT